jgi:O-antigen/teichoic acid export membrane protein
LPPAVREATGILSALELQCGFGAREGRGAVRLLRQDRISTSVGLVLGLLLGQKLVAFARGVIFARLLGTTEYGIYTLGFFLVLITVAVTSLGIPSAFGRFAPRYRSRGNLRAFFRKAYLLNMAVSVAVAVVIFLFPAFFSRLVYGDASFARVMTVVAFCIPGLVFLTNLFNTFSGLKLFRAGAAVQFCQVVIFAGLGAVAVVVYRSAESALLSYALSMLISVALFVPLLLRYLQAEDREDRPLDEAGFYRRLLRFTIWFTVTPILVQIFQYVDRLSLQRLMTASDQGIYSAALNVCATISAVGLAINNVAFPHLSTTWEEGRREKAVQNLDLTIRFTAVFLAVGGFLLALLGRPVITVLLGSEYTGGVAVVPYLVVFYLLTVSVWLFGVYASLIEKTYVSAIGLACALPVNVGLNLVLIPRLGIVGASLATMLSYSLMWFVVVGLCMRLGLPVRRETFIASLLPFVILLPKVPAAIGLGAACALCGWTDIIIRAEERHRIATELAGLLRLRRTPAD